MEKTTYINDELRVKEIIKRRQTIISVIDKGRETLLSNVRTSRGFWNKWMFNDYYVVSYTRGYPENRIPLNIESAYSIKNRELMDLSDDRLKVLLEYMFLLKDYYEAANILEEINTTELGLLCEIEKEDLVHFLTSGNKKISHEEIVNYILQIYPQFIKFRNLKEPLSVLDYRSICLRLGLSKFGFHSMPQDLSFYGGPKSSALISNRFDYNEIYRSEAEQERKVLSLEKHIK